MKLALLGIGLGLAAALALTRLMSALLFEVSASEPSIYLAIATLLCAVAAVACWIPSRRAARLDPMRAVRAT
jgi:ABC-type antimicrobial peptide transport system permease subunit